MNLNNDKRQRCQQADNSRLVLSKQRLTASERKWPVRWADVRGEERVTSLRTSAWEATMLVPLGRAPTWRLHTKRYKFGWNSFSNNVEMKNRTDLNLGEVVYISIIYHIPDSWLNLLGLTLTLTGSIKFVGWPHCSVYHVEFSKCASFHKNPMQTPGNTGPTILDKSPWDTYVS